MIIEEPGMAESQREAGRAPMGRVIGGAGPQGLPDENEISGPPGTGVIFTPHATRIEKLMSMIV